MTKQIDDAPTELFKVEVWYELETDDFTGEAASAFAAYDEQNETLKLHREILHDVVAKGLADRIPEGLVAVFSHRYGKFSVSPEKPRTKSTKSGGKIKL